MPVELADLMRGLQGDGVHAPASLGTLVDRPAGETRPAIEDRAARVCRACGRALDAGAKFCNSCGAKAEA
jgi:zinc ribbon protein